MINKKKIKNDIIYKVVKIALDRFTSRRIIHCFLFFGVWGLFSCEKPNILLNQPNEDVRSIGGYIQNNFNYELFSAALVYTGLMDTLANSTGPFTILAPDDAAFNALGITNEAQIRAMNRDSLRYVMQYHILTERLLETDFSANSIDKRYRTLSGSSLYASRAINSSVNANYNGRSYLYFSGALASNKDLVLSNGIMHTLSKVMKPHPSKTVQQLLAEKPQYSTLVAGLKKFNLWDELATEGPFTVFAAQNSYLAEYGITEESIASMDVSRYSGHRLFGSYIIYDKHYFVLDGSFFNWSEGQAWYVAPLRNDPGYYQLFMNLQMYSYFTLMLYQNASATTYTLGVSKQTFPYGYYTGTGGGNLNEQYAFNREYFLGKSSQLSGAFGINMGNAPALNDQLCSNGLVHDLQGVLVRPEEAVLDN